ncbi:MAG TPA: hypothetical protein VG122_13380 [Gemmata sp.]|jgi:hypothetical protein|nr:hypothetical protein [Gemmata sp.]
MIRSITYGGVLCLLMAQPADLFAQFNPNGSKLDPSSPGTDPRVLRANRERAVAKVGPESRDFVETYGEEAVAAIFKCSKAVAVKLVQLHNSGEMGKLPKPRDLLRVIGQPRHGDDVAIWAVHHVGELGDMDSFAAYLSSPLEYALGLKPLAAGAAEARARRLNPATMTTTPGAAPLAANVKLVIALVVIAIVGLLLWRRRKSEIC